MRRSASARPDLRHSPHLLRPARTESARRPPRRTQESRSRAAREKLLRATLEILQERGYAGLTTKEVAARAGFSNGALMHHFSTKADLVIAAGAHIYERHIAEGRKIAASDMARNDPLKAFIADCENVYLGSSFIPTIEMMVAARSDPLMDAPFDAFMRDYRKTMNEIWMRAFMRAGYSEAEASFTIMSTLYVIRGMAINSIWQKNMPYYRSFLREWVKIEKAGALKSGRVPVR
ncbi:TetR/AcrR family transcriptional regulator [Pseudorhodoplanes sp.]|uniref:TetR/AcrR family transcriptional regulator n=1 Tax=Pseudorhodoplanes sp. TaxID=1934341 RepID=UPI003918B2E5